MYSMLTPSNANLIVGITTPISLIAFFISIYYRYKYRESKNDIKKLEKVPENERSDLIKSLEIDYPSLIEINKLSKDQRFLLAMEQIKNKEKERRRRSNLTLIICILSLIVVLVYVFKPSDNSSNVSTKTYKNLHSRKISTKKYDGIESKFFIPVNDSSDESKKYKSVLDLYYRANNELVQLLKNTGREQKIIFISAVAGYGKTTFMDDLCKNCLKEYSKTNIIDFNKETQLFKENKVDLSFEEYRIDSELKINFLPYLRFDKFEFGEFFPLKEIEKPYLILDDLDEVHTELAQSIIQKAFNFINDCRGPKTLILIGRPEVFNEYMRLPDFKKGFIKKFETYELKQIQYKSLSDIRLRVLNYSERNNKKWNVEEIDKKIKEISEYINGNKFVSYSFSNLSLCNILIASINTAPPLPSVMKDVLFADLLDRASKKHFRPSFVRPTNLEMYMDALEFVAAKYCSIDNDGFFVVQPTDFVNFSSAETETDLKVNVASLLNRSGLITIQPFNDKGMKYRFEPFWIHKYLIDKYNDKCK